MLQLLSHERYFSYFIINFLIAAFLYQYTEWQSVWLRYYCKISTNRENDDRRKHKHWTNTSVVLSFVMVESIIRISDGFGDRVGLPVTFFVRYPLSLLSWSKNLYVPAKKRTPRACPEFSVFTDGRKNRYPSWDVDTRRAVLCEWRYVMIRAGTFTRTKS